MLDGFRAALEAKRDVHEKVGAQPAAWGTVGRGALVFVLLRFDILSRLHTSEYSRFN